MADVSVENQCTGELNQAERGSNALYPAGQQSPEAVEPAVNHFRHPASRRVTIWMAGGLSVAALVLGEAPPRVIAASRHGR